MIYQITNYKIRKKISLSENSAIYRGIRQLDNQAVILKVQAFEYPGAEKLERYQQEYQILRQLDSVEGVIKAYDLKEEDKNIVIILEDFGALSLKEWFNQQERTISISKFLSLAKQLAVILSQIHREKIIHQDINPANILLNPETEVDLIPELELIIGSQPPVPEMFADVSQNRLSYLSSQFIRACCSLQQPLVIFLDDLQWADPASLKLIQSMLTDPEGRSLLVIGGYEPKEIQPSHPLNQTLEELASAEIIFQSIFLAPLTTDTIARMIADTLHTDGELTQPLATIIAQKTGGNPFFIQELLATLHREQLVSFNFQTLAWQWDLEEIAFTDIRIHE